MIQSIKNSIQKIFRTPFYLIRDLLKFLLHLPSIRGENEITMINLIKNTINKLTKSPSLKIVRDTLKIALKLGFTEAYSRILFFQLEPHEHWNIDDLQFNDYSLEIKGWALAPQGNPLSGSFTINDKDFDRITYPILREDVKTIFWYYPQSEKSGFSCRANLTKEEALANGPITFKYVNKESKQSIYDYHNIYYFEDDLILPDAIRMKRVHGNDSKIFFRSVGYTIYANLKLILNRVFNKRFNDFSNILDWGCGCGRITRYFKDLKHPSITGVDIDSDNINWCRKYLGFGNYQTIPLHHPTSLKDNFFDLIMGISIFTHLREKEQYEWLGELRRISADGAILLMTICSNATVCRSNFDLPSFNAWWKNGIYIIDYPLPGFENVIDETDYYKATFHTHDYIMKNWSKSFEIVDIIPSCIGIIQDLVILRKI